LRRRRMQSKLHAILAASLLLAATLAPADAPTPPSDAAVSDAGRGVCGTRGEASYRTDFGGERPPEVGEDDN